VKLFPIICTLVLTGCPLIHYDECDACRRECDYGENSCERCTALEPDCNDMTQETTPDA
jgi:hypothetical protein